MTVVLDSWAIMRLLDGSEPAASRVQTVIDSGDAVMSWINLGEVHYVLQRARGAGIADETVRDIEQVVRAVLPDRALVLDAAAIKSAHRMSYADAFAAATAVHHGAALWTGDPELLIAGAPWHPFDPSIEPR
jgi:predicted nucleic acid-binding protein